MSPQRPLHHNVFGKCVSISQFVSETTFSETIYFYRNMIISIFFGRFRYPFPVQNLKQGERSPAITEVL